MKHLKYFSSCPLNVTDMWNVGNNNVFQFFFLNRKSSTIALKTIVWTWVQRIQQRFKATKRLWLSILRRQSTFSYLKPIMVIYAIWRSFRILYRIYLNWNSTWIMLYSNENIVIFIQIRNLMNRSMIEYSLYRILHVFAINVIAFTQDCDFDSI